MEKALSTMSAPHGEHHREPRPSAPFSQVKVVGQSCPSFGGCLPGRHDRDGRRARSGGLSEFVAGNRAKIVRSAADGKQQEIPVKLANLLNKGDMKQNVALKPGDVLVVPQSRF